jgi:hypothetical protein
METREELVAKLAELEAKVQNELTTRSWDKEEG